MRRSRLKSLITGSYSYRNFFDEIVTEETDGAYGEAIVGLDKGSPLSVLDVIDAEQSLAFLDEDEAAKAAATLAMCGWRPSQLGGLFHPKLSGGRPGNRLLADAVSTIMARQKKERYDEEARRRELRS